MKCATAYKRRKRIYLHSYSKTTAGAWIATAPFVPIEESESPSCKGNNVREVLRHSQEGVPHPKNWGLIEPMLKLAGVTSWSKFAASAAGCFIELEGDQVHVIPNKNLGPKKQYAYVQIQDRKMVISAGASDEELGILLEKAFEACE
jgi:hypothetical protein